VAVLGTVLGFTPQEVGAIRARRAALAPLNVRLNSGLAFLRTR
jgi:hypothetical protein